MRIIQAYQIFRAGGLLGRFLKKEDAEALRDKENAAQNGVVFKVHVHPCFLLEFEQDGIVAHFALQPVTVK